MPPNDPNKMPEFKVINGWNVAVSGPVHNPAAAAMEKAAAAAEGATPNEYRYVALEKSAAETGALGSNHPSNATVENDHSGTAGNGYVWTLSARSPAARRLG
jgi:hypothetical protein